MNDLRPHAGTGASYSNLSSDLLNLPPFSFPDNYNTQITFDKILFLQWACRKNPKPASSATAENMPVTISASKY